MRVPFNQPTVDLTYCTNIHPAETAGDIRRLLDGPVKTVAGQVAPDRAFGIGLRLSNRSAAEFDRSEEAFEQLARALVDNGFYLFTLNGFPYGDFHGKVVKERVYWPDWRCRERVDYTAALARLLARLMPESRQQGTISTVPGSYRAWIQDEQAFEAVLRGLACTVRDMAEIEEDTGRRIRIALEPEPDCLWDSVQDMITLFQEILPDKGATILRDITGWDKADCQSAFNRYLGVCFDCCHHAVSGEPVVESLERLLAADVPVVKLHISAAPCGYCTETAIAAFNELADDVYLHQCALESPDGDVQRFADLPQAIAAARRVPDDWILRSHVHFPLTCDQWNGLWSTRRELSSGFFQRLSQGTVPHVEVETYTFDVLPESVTAGELTASITEELRWVLAGIEASG